LCAIRSYAAQAGDCPPAGRCCHGTPQTQPAAACAGGRAAANDTTGEWGGNQGAERVCRATAAGGTCTACPLIDTRACPVYPLATLQLLPKELVQMPRHVAINVVLQSGNAGRGLQQIGRRGSGGSIGGSGSCSAAGRQRQRKRQPCCPQPHRWAYDSLRVVVSS